MTHPIPPEAQEAIALMREIERTTPLWLSLIIGRPKIPVWVQWTEALESGEITWPQLQRRAAACFERSSG